MNSDSRVPLPLTITLSDVRGQAADPLPDPDK